MADLFSVKLFTWRIESDYYQVTLKGKVTKVSGGIISSKGPILETTAPKARLCINVLTIHH